MTGTKTAKAPKAGRCAICGRSAVKQLRPFCSRRCADIDLGRWLGGHYAIASEEGDGPGLDPPPSGDEDEQSH